MRRLSFATTALTTSLPGLALSLAALALAGCADDTGAELSSPAVGVAVR